MCICVYFWPLFHSVLSVCLSILEPGTFMHGMLMHTVAQERWEPACVTLSLIPGWRWSPDSERESERTRDRQGDKLGINLSFPFVHSEAMSSISRLLAGLQLSQEWSGLLLSKLAHLLEPQFFHLQNGNNYNTYVMFPGFHHLILDKGAVVKAAINNDWGQCHRNRTALPCSEANSAHHFGYKNLAETKLGSFLTAHIPRVLNSQGQVPQKRTGWNHGMLSLTLELECWKGLRIGPRPA